MRARASNLLVTQTNLREFFQTSVSSAVDNQSLEVSEATVRYVVELLVGFGRSERLFDRTDQGVHLRPLALLYFDAAQSPNPETRRRSLKRLGDVALFIAGVFSESLRRKPVDVDYYVSMGERAYGYLSEARPTAQVNATLADVFAELSTKFVDFVDVLNEVSEHTTVNNDTDLLRLYERWQRTGSRRIAERLRELGIEPTALGADTTQH